VTQIHRPARLATPAASFRYGGRHHSGIPGDIIPLYPGDFVGIRRQMIQRLSDTFGINPPQEVEKFFRLFNVVLSDDAYKALVLAELGDGHDFDQRKLLLEFGNFNIGDLCQLLVAVDPQKTGVRIPIVSALLRRLLDWALVFDNDFGLANQYARYSWSKEAIGLFRTLDILDNVLLGRQHIVQKYSPSVPAIIVEKDGVERVGTGFLVHDHYSGKFFSGRGFIVTAKHNVDREERSKFLRFGGDASLQFEPEGTEWSCHPTLDLAAMRVTTSSQAKPLYPLGDPLVLSPTISMGYPAIATTDGSYLLAHSGELNALVTSYLDKQSYLVISNDVSPGNSGGPVLDDSGLCVGMVIRALETEHEGGTSKRNVALRATEIQQFIHALHVANIAS
jgi:S1-C subfamily serine protease